jgi:predicted metal-dependent HD superfamily phosphohydrolase
LSEELRRTIIERHGEPHRHYHTLRHVGLMLSQLPPDHPCAREMIAATLFHDIVYDPAKSDNEEQSLAVFEAAASALATDGPLVSAMILATKSHHFRKEATVEDEAINLLLKADLSILWTPDPECYAWYAGGVRLEYGFVAEDLYRQARTRIVTGLRDDLLRSGKLVPEETECLKRNIAWELECMDSRAATACGDHRADQPGAGVSSVP